MAENGTPRTRTKEKIKLTDSIFVVMHQCYSFRRDHETARHIQIATIFNKNGSKVSHY